MREFMSPRIADDVDRARYQLERSRAKKAYKTLMVWFRNRLGDRDACKGCGYQKCNCPPEAVEEAGPVWTENGQYVYPHALPGDVLGLVDHFPNARQYKALHYGAAGNHNWVWRDTEADAREWVEEQHAAQAEPVEVKPAGEWKARPHGRIRYFLAGAAHCSGRVEPAVAPALGQYYGAAGNSFDYFDTEAEAKAWVDGECS